MLSEFLRQVLTTLCKKTQFNKKSGSAKVRILVGYFIYCGLRSRFFLTKRKVVCNASVLNTIKRQLSNNSYPIKYSIKDRTHWIFNALNSF